MERHAMLKNGYPGKTGYAKECFSREPRPWRATTIAVECLRGSALTCGLACGSVFVSLPTGLSGCVSQSLPTLGAADPSHFSLLY